jgi:hypothetical protein
MRNNGNLRSLNTPQNAKLPQYIQTFLGSISTSWAYFLGTDSIFLGTFTEYL